MNLSYFTKINLFTALILFFGSGMVAQTYVGGGNPQAVPASGSGTSTCSTATTSAASVPISGTVGLDIDIDNVTLDITHTFDNDLEISLISPMGTILDLSSDNGGAGDDYDGTVFMDGSPSILTGAPPFAGTFAAEGGSFAATFAGESITGDWTLFVCDDLSGDVGTLNSFSITFGPGGGGGDCTGYPGDSEGDPLPDGFASSGSFVSEIEVGDAGMIGSDATIESVELDLDHTFDGDLEIDLVSPAGTRLSLSDNNGGAGEDYENTTFIDGGDDITLASPPFPGIYAPEGGPFASTFGGESITGTWRLEIEDLFGGDSGTFGSVTLNICTEEVTCDIAIDGASSTPASCIGSADGTITVMASCTSCSGIEYSLDNSDWSNTTGIFTGLTTGMYSIFVRDAADETCNDANIYMDGVLVEDGPLPCGWYPDEVGCSGGSASATYDVPTDIWTVSAETCYNPAFYRPTDDQGMVTTSLCGDGEIIAEVLSVSGSGFAGISMREDLSDDSKMLQLMIDGSFLTRRELRQSSPGYAYAHLFQTLGKNWLRLTRSGNTFGAYHSSDGVNWAPVLITMIPMSACIEIGLMVENNAPSGVVTGTFGSVSVSGGAPLSTPDVGFDIAHSADQPTRVEIYPNPASTEVNVKMDDFYGQAAEIQVYNELGQLLNRKVIDEVSFDAEIIDVSQFTNGTYLFKIITDTKEETRRVIVNR